MKSSRFVFLCVLIAVCSAAVASPGDWPMLRRDSQFTGRSPLKGNITDPQITGKLFAGAYEGLAVIRPGAEAQTLSVAPTPEIAPDYMATHGTEWDLDGAFYDFETALPAGAQEDIHVRYARLLPDVPGLQKVVFEDNFQGIAKPVGRMYAFDTPDGQPRLVWETEPEEDMYAPTLLITDVDADGLPEVVVATHYRVMIYNGQTGVKKTELRWHHMRNYGFFGCFTVPGEKYPKFVVIADFISHIDVLDNDGKKLRVLWRKDIEATIIRKVKITRPGPNPIADLDGDGRVEITFNLYNYTNDSKWHATSFDTLTGDIRFDMPDSYLCGMTDVDGNGLPELFLQEARGMAVPDYTRIQLVSMANGRKRTLWSQRSARWQTTDLTRLPHTANTGAGLGYRTVMLGEWENGKACFAVALTSSGKASQPRERLLVVGRNNAGTWTSQAGVTGPPGARLQVKAVAVESAKPKVLLSWRVAEADSQRFETSRASGEVVSWRAVPGPKPIPIVARLRPDEGPTIVFQNGCEEVAAYQKAADGWRMRWKQPGRGMTVSAPVYVDIPAADVDGDGETEVLPARPSSSGEAQMVALTPDGRVKWRHTFKGADGKPPVWNFGGITMWTVGHFTSLKHLDVLVVLRHSTMHSDEGVLLSGKDGRELWRKEAVWLPGDTEWETSRGYGGSFTAAADLNGDGLDEVVCAYPDRYWYASGKTGEVRTIVNTASGIFPKMWVAYATPIVADFRGEGKPQVLWAGNTYMTALLNVDGQPIWYGKYMDGPSVLQSLGDIDGSGKISIGGVYKDGFRCIDPADGSVRWTYPLTEGADPGATITADVNSDGIEEFLFTSGAKLYALNGRDGKPNLVWSLELPAVPGPLAYADVDGDGKPEILFGGSDGYVHIVEQAAGKGS